MATKEIIQTFNDLSWFLLECKLIYYRPEMFSKKLLNKLEISDSLYDELEQKYRRLARLLRRPPTIYKMIEVDLNKPCVRLSVEKLKKIDFDLRKRRFTGCKIRYRLGVTK